MQTGPGCCCTHLDFVCRCPRCWFHGPFSSKGKVDVGLYARLPNLEDLYRGSWNLWRHVSVGLFAYPLGTRVWEIWGRGSCPCWNVSEQFLVCELPSGSFLVTTLPHMVEFQPDSGSRDADDFRRVFLRLESVLSCMGILHLRCDWVGGQTCEKAVSDWSLDLQVCISGDTLRKRGPNQC